MSKLSTNITGWQTYLILKVVGKGHENYIVKKRCKENRDNIYVINICIICWGGRGTNMQYQKFHPKSQEQINSYLPEVTSPCNISPPFLWHPLQFISVRISAFQF